MPHVSKPTTDKIVTLYHCSRVAGLVQLLPHQPPEERGQRNAVFFATSMHHAFDWRIRLGTRRREDHPFLYQVSADPLQLVFWTDGQRGTKKRWYGGSTFCGQVWTPEPVACRAITWKEAMAQSGEYS